MNELIGKLKIPPSLKPHGVALRRADGDRKAPPTASYQVL